MRIKTKHCNVEIWTCCAWRLWENGSSGWDDSNPRTLVCTETKRQRSCSASIWNDTWEKGSGLNDHVQLHAHGHVSIYIQKTHTIRAATIFSLVTIIYLWVGDGWGNQQNHCYAPCGVRYVTPGYCMKTLPPVFGQSSFVEQFPEISWSPWHSGSSGRGFAALLHNGNVVDSTRY
jgi:hypothetical protein